MLAVTANVTSAGTSRQENSGGGIEKRVRMPTSDQTSIAGGLVRLNSLANGRGAPYTPWSHRFCSNPVLNAPILSAREFHKGYMG